VTVVETERWRVKGVSSSAPLKYTPGLARVQSLGTTWHSHGHKCAGGSKLRALIWGASCACLSQSSVPAFPRGLWMNVSPS